MQHCCLSALQPHCDRNPRKMLANEKLCPLIRHLQKALFGNHFFTTVLCATKILSELLPHLFLIITCTRLSNSSPRVASNLATRTKWNGKGCARGSLEKPEGILSCQTQHLYYIPLSPAVQSPLQKSLEYASMSCSSFHKP